MKTMGVCVNYHGCSLFEKVIPAHEGDECFECGFLLMHESGLTWHDARLKLRESLNERQLAFLRVLGKHYEEQTADAGQTMRSMSPGYITRQAFPDAEYRGRLDAGATRTLDSMEKLGIVSGSYRGSRATGRDWIITEEGRKVLAA